ncbi:hypothetical protein HN031_05540 [Nocardioides sp. zg-1308]|uniref:Uncharacterized protein n=1 Tax=Nocardioides renjunii TaxID=3095075 RepID=A0ABU5K827_9ACTN|nr:MULTISPECIES: hypothetical protein [unclassified Nocardioides]MDZ5661027.1 hypothetical protein [Nocardioides sp. S-58]NPD04145.1 hypothetical protein [Nocardioides sp. zg-1308]WQQ22030.1 hypothetical protein SHK17_19335 [Nocardioides sp. S-34]
MARSGILTALAPAVQARRGDSSSDDGRRRRRRRRRRNRSRSRSRSS